MLHYGVLRGSAVDSGREDNGSSPHFQIVIQASNNRWRVPVNVKSTDGSMVLFSIVEPLVNHRLIAQLDSIPEGFTPEGSNSFFLDYVREPMFDITAMRALPSSAAGPDNDLQDFISARIEVAKRDNRAIFAFGSQFPGGSPRPADKQFKTNGGVHDIHMNQGNPAGGGFAGDNGIHQDGGLIVQTGASTYAGIFLAFQSQLVPTDDHGMPLPGAKPINAADPVTGDTASNAADLSIVGACVNPLGDDVGKETVILLNASADPADLTKFAVEDKAGKREALHGTLAGGDVLKVILSGRGAQLGNNGGAIRIVRISDGGVVHAVTYTAQGASKQGRTLVF